MATIEVDFPRGRDEVQRRSVAKRKQSEDDGRTTLGAKVPRSAKLTKNKKELVWSQKLQQKDLTPGMLLLGCVRSANDVELQLELPDGFSGVVSAIDISDTFSAALRTANTDVDVIKVTSLSRVFKPGQLLCCKLKGLKSEKKRPVCILTLNPREVNSELVATTLRNDFIISASIQSVEDKGYIMDIGLPLMNAFLPFSQSNSSAIAPLTPGQTLMCCITDCPCLSTAEVVNSKVITLSIDPKRIAKASCPDDVRMDNLLPGMIIDATVERVTPKGVFVKREANVEEGFWRRGYISRRRLGKHPVLKTTEFSVGQRLRVLVAYNKPRTKVVGLTMQSHLLPASRSKGTSDSVASVSVGALLEAEVAEIVGDNRAVYFCIRGSSDSAGGKASSSAKRALYAYAPLSKLGVKEEAAALSRKFPLGSKHSCRVIGYSLMDNLLYVSTQKSVLKQSVVSIESAVLGTVVKVVIKAVNARGISAKLYNHLNAFIPAIHVADTPIQNLAQKALTMERLKVNATLKCRVLSVDNERQRLILTAKPSLVSSCLPIVSSYSSAHIGSVVDGVIVNVQPTGLLVLFFGNVKGFLSIKQLNAAGILLPEKVFKLGGVIRVKILSVDARAERMQLGYGSSSNDLADSLALKGDYRKTIKSEPLEDEAVQPPIVQAKVTSVDDKGVNVEILPQRNSGFIPHFHLTDSICEDHWNDLLTTYKPGDVLSSCCYLSHDSALSILSAKPLLVRAVAERSLPSRFEELEVGMLLVGVVARCHPQFGYFVEFPGSESLCGLCPYGSVDASNMPFLIGQTVLARIQTVELDRRRFSVSLKLRNCFSPPSVSVGLDLLRAYLEERERVTAAMAALKRPVLKTKFAAIVVGKCVDIVVDAINGDEICCHLLSDALVKGKATFLLSSDAAVIGQQYVACVLNVDFTSESIDCAVLPAAGMQQMPLKRKLADARADKAMILLIKPDFNVLFLLTSRQIAFMPSRLHPNDVTERNKYKIGETIEVVRTETFHRSVVLVTSLQNHRGLSVEAKQVEHFVNDGGILSTQRQKNVAIAVGGTYEAVVQKISPLHLQILLSNKYSGIIHVSEIADKFEDGTIPTAQFSVCQILRKVKVIGLTTVKKKNVKSRLAQCTIRPSKIFGKSNKKSAIGFKTSFRTGDKEFVFVRSARSGQPCEVELSPVWSGRIQPLDLTSDASKIANIGENFALGQVYSANVLSVTPESRRLELSLLPASERRKVSKWVSGAVVNGIVVSIQPQDGVKLRLCSGCHATATLPDVADDFDELANILQRLTVGQVVRCCLRREKFRVSLRASDTRISTSDASAFETISIRDTAIERPEDLKPGSLYRGFLKSCSNVGASINFGGVTGFVRTADIADAFIESPKDVFAKGCLVSVMVLSNDSSGLLLSMLPKDTGLPSQISLPLGSSSRKRRRQTSESSLQSSEKQDWRPPFAMKEVKKEPIEKRRRADSEQSLTSNVSRNSAASTSDVSTTKTGKYLELKNFDWNLSENFSMRNLTGVNLKREGSDFPAVKEESVGSSDDDDDAVGTAVVGNSADAEKKRIKAFQQQQIEEKRIRSRESMLLNRSEQQLDSPEDFDRLLMSSPNTSLLWLRYMAFFLETADVEKARAVSERAFKTISVREEQERLNVWIARMNLENSYGTAESLRTVYERALQSNDHLKVTRQLGQIYRKSEKFNEADELYTGMIAKHKQFADIWMEACEYYLATQRADTARELMQKALKSLPANEHVSLTNRFAQLEFRLGDKERAKTLFENIIINYPKRLDIWFVYADMTAKHDCVENARMIYERLTALRLPAKRMQSIFKKWLDFETTRGTASTVACVKSKAVEYVRSALACS